MVVCLIIVAVLTIISVVIYKATSTVKAEKEAHKRAQAETMEIVRERLIMDNEMLGIMKSLIREAAMHTDSPKQTKQKK